MKLTDVKMLLGRGGQHGDLGSIRCSIYGSFATLERSMVFKISNVLRLTASISASVMVNFLLNALVSVLTSTLLPNIVLSAPTAAPEKRALSIGIHLELDTSGLPVLTLPYASYKAATYDKSDDVCIIVHSPPELHYSL